MKITFKEMDNKKGFSAFVTTDKGSKIEQKVNECKDGTCSCNCDIEMMGKIQNIETIKNDNGLEIKITGDVSPEMIAPMMQECLGNIQ
jgi:hypothetical protein